MNDTPMLDEPPAVLVVDPHKAMTRLVRTLLSGLGFRDIDEATDSKTALRMLHDHSYGLVIVDSDAEPVSGQTLLRTVRADDRLAALPFIIMSAAATPERVASAREAEVDHYIVKPFSANALKRSLAIAIKSD